jgi:hypothetical protein
MVVNMNMSKRNAVKLYAIILIDLTDLDFEDVNTISQFLKKRSKELKDLHGKETQATYFRYLKYLLTGDTNNQTPVANILHSRGLMNSVVIMTTHMLRHIFL